MRYNSNIKRPLQLTVLVLLSLIGPFAYAQTPAPEPALTRTMDDADLQWGPCPAFMPEGCKVAVLHGDPAQDNLDVFFKAPSKSNIPLHWHTSAERMILVAGDK